MSESSQQPPADSELPQRPIPTRELRDPRILRAMAHPMRLRILDELAADGPLTATELAGRVGESAANCSWHLRQLAQYGFIEEAGGGSGRRRPWKVVLQSNTLTKPDESEPESTSAHDALVEVLMAREVDAWRAWHAALQDEPRAWRDAAIGTQSSWIWLTAEELAAFNEEFRSLFERHVMIHLDRIDPSLRPAGSRPVRFVAWGIPSGPPHAESPSDRPGELAAEQPGAATERPREAEDAPEDP